LKGDTGDTGPQGPAGATGATGPQGPAGADGASTWEAISGKPSTFAPSAHTHPATEVTGLSAVATSGSASDLSTGTLALAQLDALVAIDNQNNNFTVGQTITAAANTSALTASYSVTGANTTPLLDLTGTWNTTGVARGILLNVTDTASASGSLFADFRVGGTSRFSVSKTGSVLVSNGTGTYTSANPFLTLRNASSNSTVFFPGAIDGAVGVSVGGVTRFFFGAGTGAGIEVPSTQSLAFVNPGVSVFSTLVQDSTSPQAIAQRNGTNAQAFRLYGTFTDASNGRRLDITSTTGGVFTLTATGNGTGASGNILKLTAPVLIPAASVTLATNGDLAFEATSNTSLTIRYRGSDGTTRSASLTLS
jgi:hypothetical protein